jgi:3-phosphoshikimate 1-carboxyvinyltransferase
VRKSVKAPRSLIGSVSPPGDKSISHRAAILNAIAQGSATVTNFCPAADCQATLSCLLALGVRVTAGSRHSLHIDGVGRHGLREPEDALDAQNSGTTLRLLSGVLAAQPWLSVISGDESLRSRPMGRVIRPLRLMGAEIRGRSSDSRAPLAISGGELHGIRYRLPVASAQVKSAILLAALHAQGTTIIREPALSRDHTEKLLGAMGAGIQVAGDTITLAPGDLSAVDIDVPGDISSAACWLVGGVLHPQAQLGVLNVGVNPSRSGLLDVLRLMGAHVEVLNERAVNREPVADIDVTTSALSGVEVGGSLIPRIIDELPLVALAGCIASGETVVRDATELRLKETDRIGATVSELRKMGASIEDLPDGFRVRGGGVLRGASCDSHGDHRIAMMLGIAALIAQGETHIDNAEAVGISYPSFWQDLEVLAAGQDGANEGRRRRG